MNFGQCVSLMRRKVLRGALLAVGLGLGLVACTAQAAPNVVVSIAPVHALVAAVMDGVGSPQLLMPAAASPHSYALRPSQRRLMESAQLLIWIGPALESFLIKPLSQLARTVSVIELMAQDTVRRSETREAGVFASHVQDKGESSLGLDHRGEQGDPHLWLDPDNAIAIVKLVAGALAKLDPASAVRYMDNARQLLARIERLDVEIQTLLADVRDAPYVVFHDAYQGFERHYGLRPVAAVSVSPAAMPGTRRVLAIRQYLKDTGVRCVFSEPQYEARLLDVLTEGLDVRRGVLDPLGGVQAPGENGWLTLMRDLATNLHTCLAGR